MKGMGLTKSRLTGMSIMGFLGGLPWEKWTGKVS
jgi:hypothetical protein